MLNSSPIYHTSNPGLPPCIAHDLFEGIVNYDLFLILREMIKESWFEVNWLNAFVRIFFRKFNINDALELKFKDTKKINCKAAFWWNLIQILPAIFLDFTDDKISAPIFKMFILLKGIIDLTTAQAISKNQIAYLGNVIHDYLNIRIELFPNVKLRPKHHFVTHYPYLIGQFEPLIRFWTMRLESKHSYFKNVVRHTRNFKNVTKTCTERHQYLQSLISASGSRFHQTLILEYTNSDKEHIFRNEVKSVFVKYNIKINEFFMCAKVQYRGITFKIKS